MRAKRKPVRLVFIIEPGEFGLPVSVHIPIDVRRAIDRGESHVEVVVSRRARVRFAGAASSPMLKLARLASGQAMSLQGRRRAMRK